MCCLIWMIITFEVISETKALSLEDFLEDRALMMEEEEEMFLGSNLELSISEKFANRHLKDLKTEELLHFSAKGEEFPPGKSFFWSRKKLERSKVFELIKNMPKGLLLHTHLISIGSLNFTVQNLTYRWVSQLIQCNLPNLSMKMINLFNLFIIIKLLIDNNF